MSAHVHTQVLVQRAIDELIDTAEGQAERPTVVVIAHRLCTVVRAHQIAVMEKGTIVEMGTHPSLVQQGGVYARLVQRQTVDVA